MDALTGAVSWRLIFAVNVPFVVITLLLIGAAVPGRQRGGPHARVDWLGAALTFLGLAGPVLALIRLPAAGWASPQVWGHGIGGLALLGVFIAHERRTPAPALPLALFGRRNFTAGNLQTAAMYGGLGVTYFLLVLFLQEVAGYSALHAGLALMPVTVVTFTLSKRAGRLADRFGPRLFMGAARSRPPRAWRSCCASAPPGLRHRAAPCAPALLPRAGLHGGTAHRHRPGRRRRHRRRRRLGSQQHHRPHRRPPRHRRNRRGHLRAVHRRPGPALARASLSAAARAAVAQARSQTLARIAPGQAGLAVVRAVQAASAHAFHVGIGIAAILVAIGGLLALAAIRNPRCTVRSQDCAGGQLAGQPLDTAQVRQP